MRWGGEAKLLLGRALLEVQGDSVDAVAQPGSLTRAIVEYVAEMGVTFGATDFCAHHAVRLVADAPDDVI